MRPSLLLAALVSAALGAWAQVPLPTVEKPKAVQQPNTVTPADRDATVEPEAKPDDPNGKPEDPNGKEDQKAGEAQPANVTPTGRKANATRENVAAPGSGGAAASAGPDYSGPSILSRGMNFNRPALPANERFRPFGGIAFYHDSGVTGPYQGPTANVVNSTNTGVDLTYGITGQHVRRTDGFQLDYRGHSFLNNRYGSQDQALALAYSRVLSRRITATISEAAGLYANNFAVLNSTAQTDTSVANTALVVTPNTESFDDRTYYSTTQADVAYQQSSRLSIGFGSTGFYVKRQSANLISANGYQARTDLSYRITRRTTIGPYYAFTRYDYSRTFGDSDLHTVGLNYSYAISKTSQFRVRAGGTRLETRGLQTIVLDPQIAAIVGNTLGVQRYYTVGYLPDFAVDVSKSFRKSNLQISYLRGVSPGNGVVLTSRRESESFTYTFTGTRKYALILSGGRDSLGSVSQDIGNYKSYFGRFSVSRSLPRDLQSFFAVDYRNLGFTTGQYARNQFRVTMGLLFSPGFGPLKFW